MRGATITASTGWRHIGISTHAPLAGRDHNAVDRSHNVLISTHAPLAGRDFWGRLHRGCLTNFNPRAPCGARPAPHFGGVFSKKFQPTRPLRGATNLSCGLCGKNKNFNPRAPCGARPTPTRSQCCRNGNFNPRAPCGARLSIASITSSGSLISTHAPLAGRDALWRELLHKPGTISTHAPLAGRDGGQGGILSPSPYFNPRAPCGARRGQKRYRNNTARISTHAPLAGRDSKSVQITMHIFAITDKFQMLLHRMPPVRAFCSFLMQENHADFGCEPPK